MTETLITLPDGSLEREYPVITPDELQRVWQSYAELAEEPSRTVDVLGAAYMPEKPPTAFISLDLCEVVRHTSASLWAMEKPFGTPIANIHGYGMGMELIGDDDAKITQYITALMNNDLIQPMEHIDKMADLVRGWREQGAYVFGNTSTLPGCEEATVRYLGEHMLKCFDGILFPRNHENISGTMNKGIAARLLIEQCMQPFPEPAENSVPVVHIDDLARHLVTFRKEIGSLPYADAATFQPIYPSEYELDEHSTLSSTPLGSFHAVDAHLFDRGIIK